MFGVGNRSGPDEEGAAGVGNLPSISVGNFPSAGADEAIGDKGKGKRPSATTGAVGRGNRPSDTDEDRRGRGGTGNLPPLPVLAL